MGALIAANVVSALLMWSCLLYWLVDYTLHERTPWADTYFVSSR